MTKRDRAAKALARLLSEALERGRTELVALQDKRLPLPTSKHRLRKLEQALKRIKATRDGE